LIQFNSNFTLFIRRLVSWLTSAAAVTRLGHVDACALERVRVSVTRMIMMISNGAPSPRPFDVERSELMSAIVRGDDFTSIESALG
jgi:hypothetical protein